MLRIALGFLFCSLVAYVIGATGLVVASMDVGRICLITFLVFATLGAIVEVVRSERPKDVL